MSSPSVLHNHDLLEVVDQIREAAFDLIDPDKRSKMGQFGTPEPISRFMASMFVFGQPKVRLLDAGAGVGSLATAFLYAACQSDSPPEVIHLTAFEIEPVLIQALHETNGLCAEFCEKHGVNFSYEVIEADFIDYMVKAGSELFHQSIAQFNFAILNPPYRKIRTKSPHRRLLSRAGVEVSNLYAGFVALAIRALSPGGQLVAITPRSFCNGPYFNSFRRDFLDRMRINRLHVFNSRSEAFGGDKVLQENIIVCGTRGSGHPREVMVTSSSGAPDAAELQRIVPYHRVVPDGASFPFIYLITDGTSEEVAEAMGQLTSSLDDLGIQLSTGRVVDFRAMDFLRQMPGEQDAPLIYPGHLRAGQTFWPTEGSKKPNAIAIEPETQGLLVPPGVYVLVKRFSSKEQRRRIDAYIFDSDEVSPDSPVGFENHTNYFHEDGNGLSRDLAVGLAVYLNSTLVDLYFRLFSGHTQVNAADLRNFPFPNRNEIISLGQKAGAAEIHQAEIDELIAVEIFKAPAGERRPLAQIQKVSEARDALKQLGFDQARSNERSALTLLALLDLKPDTSWEKATAPMCGITQMMDYFREHYGKDYAPNSRETVRRQTIHQFLEAGLVEQNPDDPARPVNSGKNVYQVIPEALAVFQSYETSRWEVAKKAYLTDRQTLKERYAQRRKIARVAVRIKPEWKISLSPGGQNVLVKEVIEQFLPRFAPGAKMVYIGDTEDKFAFLDKPLICDLRIEFDEHGKFPDVIAFYEEKNWLLLIEAVTSHGPVNVKRHIELAALFGGCDAGLVYVTTFLSRKDMIKYLQVIAWETEVWVADSPGHMIHFDGKRFLGPYSGSSE